MGYRSRRRRRPIYILTYMDYNETLQYLYARLKTFHHIGNDAYNPGLENIRALSAAFGNPHRALKCVHIGGTNGKGSTAHTIAAVLQAAGYRTGLYTSPHLLDFDERIRVNGTPIDHRYVVDFVQRYMSMDIRDCDPSFFELATVMALEYFKEQAVDIAVIEVGLGGRLDSTNIIKPEVAAVTNISLEHTAILGNTRTTIAAEKSGIFKPDADAVLGEADDEILPVFSKAAADAGVSLTVAQPFWTRIDTDKDGTYIYRGTRMGDIRGQLTGECQKANAATAMAVIEALVRRGWHINDEAVRYGFAHVTDTGLVGRWSVLRHRPTVICDTGHNPGCWQYITPRLASINPHKLFIVIGFMSDKDYADILKTVPHDAHYFFVAPDTPRAARAVDVASAAARVGIHGEICASVSDGYHKALAAATTACDDGKDDAVVFVGGSNFVVAEMLAARRKDATI